MDPSSATPAQSAFDVLRTRYSRRLPARLEDLTGPAQGTVDLPLHVAWSGRRSYQLAGSRSRMSLYRNVLAEGQREDLEAVLNRELLISQWPVLRTLVSRPLRDAWEAAFPQLAARRPLRRVNLSDLHRRLLADVLAIGAPYPLVITGGYAVQVHGLVSRLSQDLDVATENPAPMSEIIRAVGDGLTHRGWSVRQTETDPLSGRLVITDPATGKECEVDVLKETFCNPRPPPNTALSSLSTM